MRLACALTALLSITLVGCVETRFESTPGDRIEACDERWKGLWVDSAETDTGRDGTQLAFFVDESCRFMLLERPEKGGPLKPIHIPLNFVHDRGADYVVVADNQLAQIVELAPIHGLKPSPKKAFFVARYRIMGKRLEIDTVDSKKVARMILDEVVDGTVTSANRELHAFVKGDRAQTLDLLRRHALFSDKPAARLEKRNQSFADFEREHMKRNRKPR